MSDLICPECGSDGKGNPIPQEYIDKGYYGTETHYSNHIGIEYVGGYDGVEDWKCGDCGHVWGRFPWSRAGK